MVFPLDFVFGGGRKMKKARTSSRLDKATLTVTGAGVLSVKSSEIVRSIKGREQIDALRYLSKHNNTFKIA